MANGTLLHGTIYGTICPPQYPHRGYQISNLFKPSSQPLSLVAGTHPNSPIFPLIHRVRWSLRCTELALGGDTLPLLRRVCPLSPETGASDLVKDFRTPVNGDPKVATQR
jgi:hypothetical protein